MVLAGGLAWAGTALGVTAGSGNPYAAIADRNVFSLRAPPPPPTNEVAVTPPQKITLLGIVTAFGRKEVLFKTMASSKPPEAPKETSYSMGIGERQGEVDILEIDDVAGSVKVMNHNVPQTLTLEKDGLKPSGSAAPTGLPAVPGVVPSVRPFPAVPMAGAGISLPSPAGGNNSVTTFGGAASLKRELRVPSATPTTAAGYAGASGQTIGGMVATPGAANLPNHMRNWPPENSALTPDEQTVSHILQNEYNKGKGLPPLPGPATGPSAPPGLPSP